MIILPNEARLAAERYVAEGLAELRKRKERKEHLQKVSEDADGVRKECETLSGFIRNAWHIPEPGIAYLSNWHIDAIAEHLEAVHRKEITRLQINMPPGMMKSTTVGVMFPAWEWGPKHSPWLRYFSTSYEAGYARRDSRKHRDLVMSEWYQTLWPDITLTKTGEDEFENTMRGGRKAVPFRRLTSGRGNRLIIDDPHSTEGAESELERIKATRMFRESASSRLNNQETDAIIVVMQRLHTDDLCGVIEEAGLPYVKLILPMEYNKSLSVKTPWFTDPRTTEGELMHPTFMSREKVEEKKIEVMEYAWSTQYQQQAMAREGAYFFGKSDILTFDEHGNLVPPPMPVRCDAVFAVIDSATKTGKKRDGTGAGYFAYCEFPQPHGFVLDWEISQMNANVLIDWLPSVLARAEELARQCGARGGSQGVYIEDKDSGQILVQQAERAGLPATAIEGDVTAMGKEGRALSASGYVRKKKLLMCEEAYNKTTVYKGRSKNHMVSQVTEFRIGHGTPLDEDELFDIFCYGALLMFGDKDVK